MTLSILNILFKSSHKFSNKILLLVVNQKENVFINLSRYLTLKLEEMHDYIYRLVVHLSELDNYRLFILAAS